MTEYVEYVKGWNIDNKNYISSNPSMAAARRYLDSLPRWAELSGWQKAGVAVTGLFSVGGLAGGIGYLLGRQGNDGPPLIPTGIATGTPEPEPTHTQTLTPTATETPTLTPSPTETPTAAGLTDAQYLNQHLNNYPVSDYPAGVNASGYSQGEVAQSTVAMVQEYFSNRAGISGIEQLDHMFGQITGQLNHAVFKDRGLNHHKRGFGMGFNNFDWGELTVDVYNVSLTTNSDGHHRAAVLVTARNIDKGVLAMVDALIAKFPGQAANRQALFDAITRGDFAIQETPDDNDPFTINDEFSACVTFADSALTRAGQMEQARDTRFNSNQETAGNGVNEETPTSVDSDSAMLVLAVVNPDGSRIWVEARSLDNRQDPLNPSINAVFQMSDGSLTRVHGGRLVPCGPAGQPVPAATPTPRFDSEPPPATPVPTNELPIPTATEGAPPPMEPTATPVPTNELPIPTATEGAPPPMEPTATAVP